MNFFYSVGEPGLLSDRKREDAGKSPERLFGKTADVEKSESMIRCLRETEVVEPWTGENF
jgi:hypothetical protein